MATVPTGELEAKLRALYLRWVRQLPENPANMQAQVDRFRRQSKQLIEREGGRIARLGVAADFPAPRELDLDLVIGTVYDDLELAVIQQQIATGLNPRLSASAMKAKSMDKSFNRLMRLARTETVRAYWKNQWDEVEGLPDIVMLWGAENGPRTCDWCKERDGMVVPGRGVRDHPQGRCTLVPTLRQSVEYKGSLADDGTIFMDPAWDQTRQRPQAVQEVKVDPTLATPSAAPVPVQTYGSQVDTKTRKARISAGDWRYVDDRAQRAAVLLQNDYRAEQAIKKVAKNLREGSDPFSGVAVPRAWSKDFTGVVTDVGAKYTQDNVKDALHDAARWLVEQETVKPRVMYKGLDVPKDKIFKLFKEGGTFDTNYSSFTTDEVVARGYSSRRATQQVVVRTKGAPGVPIKGNPTADHWKNTKEHLVTGQGRITKVVDDGRTVYVDVEF